MIIIQTSRFEMPFCCKALGRASALITATFASCDDIYRRGYSFPFTINVNFSNLHEDDDHHGSHSFYIKVLSHQNRYIIRTNYWWCLGTQMQARRNECEAKARFWTLHEILYFCERIIDNMVNGDKVPSVFRKAKDEE